MTPEQIASQLTSKFGDAIADALPDDKHPRIHTTGDKWREIAEYLHGDSELAFDWLGCISAVDYVVDGQFCAVFDLYSTTKRHWFAVKVYVDRDNPIMPTTCDLWPAGDWHEREAFDLYGILFDGHPDLRRILTDYGFIGHPFRKDFPLYGNVEVSYDTDKGRVAYQPVSIEPRTLVPRVIRDDNRYSEDLKDTGNG